VVAVPSEFPALSDCAVLGDPPHPFVDSVREVAYQARLAREEAIRAAERSERPYEFLGRVQLAALQQSVCGTVDEALRSGGLLPGAEWDGGGFGWRHPIRPLPRRPAGARQGREVGALPRREAIAPSFAISTPRQSELTVKDVALRHGDLAGTDLWVIVAAVFFREPEQHKFVIEFSIRIGITELQNDQPGRVTDVDDARQVVVGERIAVARDVQDIARFGMLVVRFGRPMPRTGAQQGRRRSSTEREDWSQGGECSGPRRNRSPTATPVE
jgi:hypothetical protein